MGDIGPGAKYFSEIYSDTYCDNLIKSFNNKNINKIYSEENLNDLKANAKEFLNTYIIFQRILNENIDTITEYLNKFNKSSTSQDDTEQNTSQTDNQPSGGGKLKRKKTKLIDLISQLKLKKFLMYRAQGIRLSQVLLLLYQQVLICHLL